MANIIIFFCECSVARVIIATASPDKFPDAVAQAIGAERYSLDMESKSGKINKIQDLFKLQTKYNDEMQLGKDWTSILREKVIDISKNV